jgi:protein O-GlcNAc transferase
MSEEADRLFVHHYVAANILADKDRLEDADAEFRAALRLRPHHAVTSFLHGNVLYRLERSIEALKAYQQALDLEPGFTPALGRVMAMQRALCMLGSAETTERCLIQLMRSGVTPWISPTDAFAIAGLTAAELLAINRAYAAKTLVDAVLRRPVASKESVPRRPLRVGYLSGDFHDHATMRLLLGVLETHDHDRVDVYCYSCGPDVRDDTRGRVVAASAKFTDVRGMSDLAAAKQVEEDKVDILVDLKGPLLGGRPMIMALRSTAIGVNWLGFPGSFGDPRLAEYIISDDVITPKGSEGGYSECVVVMPGCYQPNSGRPPQVDATSRAQSGLPTQGFIFCSFNQSHKITRRMFVLWCTILSQTPGSVLWLADPQQSLARENLRIAARGYGIKPERLIFAPFLPQAEHLARLQLADLALDTFPVTSHTTASDALWAGVPLIAMVGQTFVSRVSASVLTAIGLEALIARTEAEYLDLAIGVANDPQRLSQVKTRLSGARSSSMLFNAASFARKLESAYEAIAKREFNGQV